MLNFPFAVRHNRIWSISMLIISVLSLVMGFWLWEMLELFMGFVLLILGLFFFKNPILIVTKTELELRNGLGMTLRKTTYLPQQIRFDGYNLYVNNQRWPISRLIADRSDLEQIKDYFQHIQTN
jgi:hypothetical protein